MVSERRLLEEIIKQNVSFRIKDLQIEDEKSHEPVEYVEDLKADTSVRMRVSPDFGRDMSFSTYLRVGQNLAMSQVGGFVASFPKVERMEDTSEYDGEIARCIEEIVRALNKIITEKK
jgi:hypothetical protein